MSTLEFASDAWVTALIDTAADADPMSELAGVDLEITYVVVIDGATARSWTITIEDGAVRVRAGEGDGARMLATLPVASALAQGTRSAQETFMSGELQMGGELAPLIAHGRALSKIDDLFAPVRARTNFPN